MQFLMKFFLAASAIIVIILVMLQRGKGGGLAGALGGMGGQSAFGTKAGDLFTKITIGVASFWILVCVLTAIYAPYLSSNPFVTQTNPQRNQGDTLDASKPADSGAAKPSGSIGKADQGGKAAAPSSTEKAGEKGVKETPPASKPAEKPASTSSPPPPVSTPTVPAK